MQNYIYRDGQLKLLYFGYFRALILSRISAALARTRLPKKVSLMDFQLSHLNFGVSAEGENNMFQKSVLILMCAGLKYFIFHEKNVGMLKSYCFLIYLRRRLEQEG